MRTLIAIPAFFLALGSLPGQDPAGRETAAVWKLDYLEKTFDLKKTRMKRDGVSIILTLQFEQDTDPQKVRQALAAVPLGSTPEKHPPESVQFVFFDEENVILKRQRASAIEGEITGKAGDAFRLSVPFSSDLATATVKVEARPAGWTPNSERKTEEKK